MINSKSKTLNSKQTQNKKSKTKNKATVLNFEFWVYLEFGI